MKYLFVLSGENLELAKEEVLALTNLSKNYSIHEKSKAFLCPENRRFSWKKNQLTIDIKNKKTINFLKKRLAFTHKIIHKNKEIEIKKSFLKRKPHLRPQLHPSSLNPKLAKALINLTGIKKGKILDPFCGSAGILIEAAFMQLKPIGYDINEVMLRRAIINLTHYKIKNFDLKLKDATKIKQKFNYIITDLPYGKNTSAKELNPLYLSFLKNLKKILKKKAVICFPDFISYKKLIKQAKLNIEKKFDYYLHKSLSKKIVLIKK